MPLEPTPLPPTPDVPLIGVLLAAGHGRRFGAGNKLLADWRGLPLVSAAAKSLQAAVDGPCVAVIRDPALIPLLSGYRIIKAGLDDDDMAASFRLAIGAADAAGAQRALVALGDMPLVPFAHLRALVTASSADHASATAHGPHPGVPACLPRRLFGQAMQMRGDRGARTLLTGSDTRLIPLDKPFLLDIDRPIDLAAGQRPGRS